MEWRIYARSVLGSNLPAGVRPDNADLYLQLDVHRSHLLDEGGLWHGQHYSCETNVNINGALGVAVVRVANPFKGVYDSVWSTQNNEIDSDVQSLEDGRSRRYFVELGNFWSMISSPIVDTHIPIQFSRLSTHPDFCLGMMHTVRIAKKCDIPIEIMITIIFGKNVGDYARYTREDYTNSIRQLMTAADRAAFNCGDWKGNSNEREWLLLIVKDHSSRADSLDVDSFLARFGRKWNMPPKNLTFSDPTRQAGWLDIYGWRSSTTQIRVDTLVHDFDDHSPVMFTIQTPYGRVKPSEEKALLSKYFIRNKWTQSPSYTMHDGRVLSEMEYQHWRRTAGIEW